MENFEINSDQIDKIEKITTKEKDFRVKNLKLFQAAGFPNKNLEDWKFSDFKNIINNNFEELKCKSHSETINKLDLIKDFEHNYIFLVNGNLYSNNFNYEDINKIKINSYDKSLEHQKTDNSLIHLNHALADNGFSLEVEKNYKFKKVLVIYNYFSKNIKNKILNNKSKIKLNENTELHIIEYTINETHNKFINNSYENIYLCKNSKLRNIYLQKNKSEGFFYKFVKNQLSSNSNYLNFIFSSGLKFNKLDIECDLIGENANCNIMSALHLGKDEHQEIKTFINHLQPNCKSYQKVKNVLSSESRGVFQGKIFVKDIAQKTDAYQLSKALLLNDNAEFNSKPELEIYADDVKCSHGSTSGNVDDNSVHYLMTRGLTRKQSIQLLINGFLNEVIGEIKNKSIREFVENKMELQIYGY